MKVNYLLPRGDAGPARSVDLKGHGRTPAMNLRVPGPQTGERAREAGALLRAPVRVGRLRNGLHKLVLVQLIRHRQRDVECGTSQTLTLAVCPASTVVAAIAPVGSAADKLSAALFAGARLTSNGQRDAERRP